MAPFHCLLLYLFTERTRSGIVLLRFDFCEVLSTVLYTLFLYFTCYDCVRKLRMSCITRAVRCVSTVVRCGGWRNDEADDVALLEPRRCVRLVQSVID